MSMQDIIRRKRDGFPLTRGEIDVFIEGYTEESIPDYQAAALLMAIYFQKMNREETFFLTDAMRRSGDVIDLSGISGIKVDKHSTGGVGDKTTLIVGPIAAACGVPVAKMSGRGLGFTGGTIDKLSAIPGFQTSLTREEFIDRVNRIQLSVIGQTAAIAVADKKLYALRDVTGTVENTSLIAASIMSKKLASGSDAIVLDVKCGAGAFMKTQEAAEELADMMVALGNADGKKTIGLITSMDQPLGNAVGNGLEVWEAIQTLRGNGPEDLLELSVELAGYMIYAGEQAKTPEEGKRQAREALDTGRALEKFRELVREQGGEDDFVENVDRLIHQEDVTELMAPAHGYVTEVDAGKIGMASQKAGAGREQKDDAIDLTAGILLDKKCGDFVEQGERLARIFGADEERRKRAVKEAHRAFRIEAEAKQPGPIVRKVLS